MPPRGQLGGTWAFRAVTGEGSSGLCPHRPYVQGPLGVCCLFRRREGKKARRQERRAETEANTEHGEMAELNAPTVLALCLCPYLAFSPSRLSRLLGERQRSRASPASEAHPAEDLR